MNTVCIIKLPVHKYRRIKPVSDEQRKRNAEYKKMVLWWRTLPENEYCHFPECSKKADKSPHHGRGRVSTLLFDMRHWHALCRDCHMWCHRNVERARMLGFFCPKGLWNTPDKPPQLDSKINNE